MPNAVEIVVHYCFSLPVIQLNRWNETYGQKKPNKKIHPSFLDKTIFHILESEVFQAHFKHLFICVVSKIECHFIVINVYMAPYCKVQSPKMNLFFGKGGGGGYIYLKSSMQMNLNALYYPPEGFNFTLDLLFPI